MAFVHRYLKLTSENRCYVTEILEELVESQGIEI